MDDRRASLRRTDDARKREVMVAAALITRWGARLLAGYLLLLTVAVVGVFVLQTDTSELADHVHTADFKICHRLNLVRAGDNVSHLVEWTILSHVREQPLQQLAMRLTWIPLTRSCQAAVDHPDSFHAPAPVYFSRAVPTARDLQVGPGE